LESEQTLSDLKLGARGSRPLVLRHELSVALHRLVVTALVFPGPCHTEHRLVPAVASREFLQILGEYFFALWPALKLSEGLAGSKQCGRAQVGVVRVCRVFQSSDRSFEPAEAE